MMLVFNHHQINNNKDDDDHGTNNNDDNGNITKAGVHRQRHHQQRQHHHQRQFFLLSIRSSTIIVVAFVLVLCSTMYNYHRALSGMMDLTKESMAMMTMVSSSIVVPNTTTTTTTIAAVVTIANHATTAAAAAASTTTTTSRNDGKDADTTTTSPSTSTSTTSSSSFSPPPPTTTTKKYRLWIVTCETRDNEALKVFMASAYHFQRRSNMEKQKKEKEKEEIHTTTSNDETTSTSTSTVSEMDVDVYVENVCFQRPYAYGFKTKLLYMNEFVTQLAHNETYVNERINMNIINTNTTTKNHTITDTRSNNNNNNNNKKNTNKSKGKKDEVIDLVFFSDSDAILNSYAVTGKDIVNRYKRIIDDTVTEGIEQNITSKTITEENAVVFTAEVSCWAGEYCKRNVVDRYPVLSDGKSNCPQFLNSGGYMGTPTSLYKTYNYVLNLTVEENVNRFINDDQGLMTTFYFNHHHYNAGNYYRKPYPKDVGLVAILDTYSTLFRSDLTGWINIHHPSVNRQRYSCGGGVGISNCSGYPNDAIPVSATGMLLQQQNETSSSLTNINSLYFPQVPKEDGTSPEICKRRGYSSTEYLEPYPFQFHGNGGPKRWIFNPMQANYYNALKRDI